MNNKNNNANRSVVSVNEITRGVNSSHFDIKRAIKMSFSELKMLISDYADPDKALVIDGRQYKGADKNTAAATLALQNKYEQLQNRSSTMLSIFDALFKLQNKLTQ